MAWLANLMCAMWSDVSECMSMHEQDNSYSEVQRNRELGGVHCCACVAWRGHHVHLCLVIKMAERRAKQEEPTDGKLHAEWRKVQVDVREVCLKYRQERRWRWDWQGKHYCPLTTDCTGYISSPFHIAHTPGPSVVPKASGRRAKPNMYVRSMYVHVCVVTYVCICVYPFWTYQLLWETINHQPTRAFNAPCALQLREREKE